MLLLIVWLGIVSGANQKGLWFMLGATFALAGDVLLMLPRNLFLPGLTAFLLGHLCYILGFNLDAVVIQGLGWLYTLIVFISLSAANWQVYRRLEQGLIAKKLSALKMPVLLYSTVISIMVFSALLNPLRPDLELTSVVLSIAGALFFYLSDTLLALDRFVGRIPHAGLLVMTTYHLGQLGILLSVGLYSLD